MLKRFFLFVLVISGLSCGIAYGMQFVEIKNFGNGILEMPVTVEIDGKFCYVLEASSGAVNQFALNGKWIRAIGGRGQGPGKLSNPFGFHVQDGKLYLLNYLPPQLAVYETSTGRFRFVMRIPVGTAMGMAMNGTDCFILTNGFGSLNGNGKLVIKMKLEGNHLERQSAFKNAREGDKSSRQSLTENQGVCSTGVGLVTFAFIYDNAVFQFDMNGTLVSTNHLPIQRQPLKVKRRGSRATYSKGTIMDMQTVGNVVWILANEPGVSSHSVLFSFDRGKIVRIHDFKRELRSFAVAEHNLFVVDQEEVLIRVYKIENE